MPILFLGGILLQGEAMAAPISCSSGVSGCHFNPTVKDGTGRNIPGGLFTGSHARHAGYSTGSKRQYQYACTRCHPSVSTNNHQDGFKNITGSSLPGNRYSRGKSIANINSPSFGNCGNIYCHSSGRGTGMGQMQYSSSRWAGTEGCLGCHAGRNGASGAPARSVGNFTLTTSHSQHLKYPAANINCQICHAKTATDAATLKNFTGVQHHVNGVRDVTFTNIAYASYTSYKSTESGSVANTRVCTNTSCHGGTTRSAWSSSTNNTNHTCTHCHGLASGVAASVPNTEPFRRVFAPGWGGTGTSTDNISVNTNIRVGGHFVHLSSVYMKRLKCNECHLVPSTPFSADTNHTLNTTRFNSGTLTFGQASSARMIGGATPGQLASFAGYTNGTPVKAATCSSVYCHGNRMPSLDTSGSNRKPAWSQNLTTGTPGTTECGRCHGNPPTAGASSGTHSGQTPTTSCSGCHGSVVDGTGKIINKALHINGIANSSGGSGCTGCHGTLVNADFIKPSRHVNNGTTTKIVTDYDCIVCHAEGVAQASGVTRSDLHTGTGTTTGNVDLRNVDSVSTAQSGGTSGSNYYPWPHRRASAALAKGSANTTYRNNMDTFCLNCHDDNGASGIAVNNSNDGLLLSALNTTVRTVTSAMGGTNANPNSATVAQRPFNTEDNLRNGNDAALAGNGSSTIGTWRTSTYGRVLNVKSQFNSGGVAGTAWASHHNLNQYTKRYTSNSTVAGTGGIQYGAWTNYVTKENVTMNSASGGAIAGLHCSDCHLNEVNAHGTTNAWYMLMNVGTVAPFDETGDNAPTTSGATSAATVMTCNLCHANASYSPTGTGTAAAHYPHNPRCQNVDVVTGTAIEAPFGNNCHGCHGGYGNTADTTNQDSIGTGSAKVGRGALGTIHGNNESYNPASGATASKRYRFMSGATMRFYNPNNTTAYSGTANWESTTAAGCYTISSGQADTWAGGCSSHSGGGTGQTKNSGRLLTY